MYILQIELNEGSPLAVIKASPRFLNRSSVWCLEMNGTEAHIRKDDSGIWMQHSNDNLSPEIVAQVGKAIEDLFLQKGMTSA